MDPGTETALNQARALLGSAATPAGAEAGDPVALAWALKALCYEAWSTEPPRAVRAAQTLRTLLNAEVPADQQAEIAALADWTGGLAAVIGGQMAEAVRLFDSAATGLRAAGLPDPAAQTQVPKIMALSMLGQHEQAAACAVVAQRELRALGNLRVAARVSQNLGALQFRRDAYADAARHHREAAVLFARLRDHAHSVLADIGLADALTATGDFDEALRIYARARMRASQRGLELQLAMIDESVALLDLACGRYREALAGLASARSRYQALTVPHCLAIAEKQLADAYLELRLLPEAQALFDTAVQRFGELELPDEAAWALAQRARTEALMGQAGAAASSLVEASALFDRQGNAVGSAAVALTQAELALAGGQAGAALGHAEQARRGFDAAGQADGQARAEVLCAQAHWLAGHRVEAERGFQAALASATRLQQWPVQQRCLTGLGLAALANGQAQAASAHFEAAIESFEARRRALPGDEIRSAFLTDHLRPYLEQLRGALAGGDGAQVLWQLERFRARALDERLAEGAHSAAEGDTPALRDRLNWLYRRVQRLQDEGSATAVLDEELRRTERELLERSRRPPLPACRVLALGESSRLSQAAAEARAVADLFAQGQAFVGADATLALLRRQAGQADVLHLACHAQFRGDNPRFSALHLHDEVLTADQVETLGLRPCTVVLSACETGLADTGTGDERIGLVRAFGVAGAARVLASLWPVDVGNAWVLAEAMLYALDPDGNPATDDGAHVINLSLGSLVRTRLMDSIALLAACAPAVPDDAIADRSDPGYRDDEQRCANSNGAVVVAAAGNDASKDEKQYPAAEGAYGLLSVGASNAAGRPAGFSNFGPWIDLAAPGEGVTSAVTGGWGTWSGTSMASPLAAGTAALLRSMDLRMAPADVVKRLKRSTASLCGTALRQVDAGAAVNNRVVASGNCP